MRMDLHSHGLVGEVIFLSSHNATHAQGGSEDMPVLPRRQTPELKRDQGECGLCKERMTLSPREEDTGPTENTGQIQE